MKTSFCGIYRLGVCLGLSVLATAGVWAETTLTRDDGILLGLIFRNRVVPAAQATDASDALKRVVQRAEELGRGGKLLERYRVQIEGLARTSLGGWNEGIEVATVMDMRTGAKLFQPGDVIDTTVFPVYDWIRPLTNQYAITVNLVGPDGERMGPSSSKLMSKVESASLPLTIPKGATPGRYGVEFVLMGHTATPEPILVAERSVYVIDDLRSRLEKLGSRQDLIKRRNAGSDSPRMRVAMDTIDWYLRTYGDGLEGDVPGAYTMHPMLMHSAMVNVDMAIDKMVFDEELALAESLVESILDEGDPFDGRTGDMRLAYRSPVDGALVPFRIYVADEGMTGSSGEPVPLVMGLHGAGGDENSFMDRYKGQYKANAKKRGYLVVTANGRGPYGGYRGASGEDVLDVLDLVAEMYQIDSARTYLMGHSMGGGGTVALGLEHPERFAALAPIAGFGNPALLEKAPEMPVFLGQGEADALVPAEAARLFAAKGKALEMDFEYVELAGIDHIEIVELVMDRAFDWFDAHVKK